MLISIRKQIVLQKNECQQLYHTSFKSYSIQEQILIHEGNCQQLYHAIADFCCSQEQTLMFHHFLKQFYHIFFESYLDQKQCLVRKANFLTACLHIFFSFKMTRNKFLHFWISHYCSNTYFYKFIDVYTIFTINHFIYTKTKKS